MSVALYNHFKTKDELVDALLDRVLPRLLAPLFTQPNPASARRSSASSR
jgi:AcrR family transcriptional regulator